MIYTSLDHIPGRNEGHRKLLSLQQGGSFDSTISRTSGIDLYWIVLLLLRSNLPSAVFRELPLRLENPAWNTVEVTKWNCKPHTRGFLDRAFPPLDQAPKRHSRP